MGLALNFAFLACAEPGHLYFPTHFDKHFSSLVGELFQFLLFPNGKLVGLGVVGVFPVELALCMLGKCSTPHSHPAPPKKGYMPRAALCHTAASRNCYPVSLVNSTNFGFHTDTVHTVTFIPRREAAHTPISRPKPVSASQPP